MGTHYWTQIYEPMTRQHYAAGGFYRVIQWTTDDAGRINGQAIGSRLTLVQALTYRGDFQIIFGRQRARR